MKAIRTDSLTDSAASRHWTCIARTLTPSIAALAAVTAGCLPRGAPPAGRQIIADRQVSLVANVLPASDGVFRILFTRPGATPGSKDLYVIGVDATGETSAETLLVPDFDATVSVECSYNASPCDSVGSRSVIAYTRAGDRLRVDPVTGDRAKTSIGSWSPSHQRLFAFVGTTAFISGPGPGMIFEGDGTTTALDDVAYRTFADNDDFYYVTSDGTLFRIPPSGLAEQVTTGLAVPTGVLGVGSLFTVPSPDGTILILSRPAGGSTNVQAFVRDPATGLETALPFIPSRPPRLSPDGRWLVDVGDFDGHFTFFDYRASDTETADLPPFSSGGFWRPGHTELWATGQSTAADGTTEPDTWILRPGGQSTVIRGLAVAGDFTPDGTYWQVTTDWEVSKPRIQVGLADDPTGPAYALSAPETYAAYMEPFSNDLMVTETYTRMEDYQERMDMSLFDPHTGSISPLGDRGRLAALGQTRLMGMFHFDEERGDLTVTELASGHQTILAPEFTVAAFADPQGADQLAPGTRIAYQFQARTDSPYDGIWAVSCP